jgi:competence protein ComGC
MHNVYFHLHLSILVMVPRFTTDKQGVKKTGCILKIPVLEIS